jgi:hypothetical protein
MARPLRIEYPDAVYHVTCRSNKKQIIFSVCATGHPLDSLIRSGISDQKHKTEIKAIFGTDDTDGHGALVCLVSLVGFGTVSAVRQGTGFWLCMGALAKGQNLVRFSDLV